MTTQVLYDNAQGTLGTSLDGSSGSEPIGDLFQEVPPFATLSVGQIIKLILDANTDSFEIAYLTSYTEGSRDGVLLRGQEGTSPQVHSSSGTWVNAPTVADFANFLALDAGGTVVGPVQLGNVGFFGTTPGTKPTITGSKSANAALASLITHLATLGLVTDSTT